jgi:uncharacterized membrane protein
MVLEMKVPHGEGLGALSQVLPGFLSYVQSFTYVGFRWSNHHHMLHTILLRSQEESRQAYLELAAIALERLKLDELAGTVIVVTYGVVRIRLAPIA